jgi:hypothetical protein
MQMCVRTLVIERTTKTAFKSAHLLLYCICVHFSSSNDILYGCSCNVITHASLYTQSTLQLVALSSWHYRLMSAVLTQSGARTRVCMSAMRIIVALRYCYYLALLLQVLLLHPCKVAVHQVC